MAVQQAYVLECACRKPHGDRWWHPYDNFWVLTYRSCDRASKWLETEIHIQEAN